MMKIDYCCEKMMRAKVGLQKGHLCLGDVEIYHCPFCGERIEIPISLMMQADMDDRETIAPVDKIKDVFSKLGIGRGGE